MADGYKYKVDNKMGWQGEIDEAKKVIKVNKERSKKKSSIIDTIVHEELHRKHPQMHEKTVYKLAAKVVKNASDKEKQRLYSKFK